MPLKNAALSPRGKYGQGTVATFYRLVAVFDGWRWHHNRAVGRCDGERSHRRGHVFRRYPLAWSQPAFVADAAAKQAVTIDTIGIFISTLDFLLI